MGNDEKAAIQQRRAESVERRKRESQPRGSGAEELQAKLARRRASAENAEAADGDACKSHAAEIVAASPQPAEIRGEQEPEGADSFPQKKRSAAAAGFQNAPNELSDELERVLARRRAASDEVQPASQHETASDEVQPASQHEKSTDDTQDHSTTAASMVSEDRSQLATPPPAHDEKGCAEVAKVPCNTGLTKDNSEFAEIPPARDEVEFTEDSAKPQQKCCNQKCCCLVM